MNRSPAPGFTLIELVCTLVIACLLVSLAYPSYLFFVLRSHRLDGHTALLQLQTLEERYRSTNTQYGDLNQLGAAGVSPAGFYAVDISSATTNSYELIASALRSQQGDSKCRHMKLAVVGENILYTSGADINATNSPADNKQCWGI